MVLIQCGSGVPSGPITLAGGFVAAALFGLVQPYLVPAIPSLERCFLGRICCCLLRPLTIEHLHLLQLSLLLGHTRAPFKKKIITLTQ